MKFERESEVSEKTRLYERGPQMSKPLPYCKLIESEGPTSDTEAYVSPSGTENASFCSKKEKIPTSLKEPSSEKLAASAVLTTEFMHGSVSVRVNGCDEILPKSPWSPLASMLESGAPF